MPFPTKGWPPRRPSGIRSIRFHVSGTTTANFSDNAFLFYDDAGANTFTPTPVVPPGAESLKVEVGLGSATLGATAGPPYGTGPTSIPPDAVVPTDITKEPQKEAIWANTILVRNDKNGALEISFDGTNVHDTLLEGEQQVYRNRFEAGICIRGKAGDAPAFRITAW